MPLAVRCAAPLLLLTALCGGCVDDGRLRLQVDGGRKLIAQDSQEITIGLEGALAEKAEMKQVLTWQMAFSKPGSNTQAVSVECQKADITGKGMGAAYDPELLKSSLAKARIDLVVDFKGRTISYGEPDPAQGDKAASAVASSIVSEMKVLGPLGVVFPDQPVKPGAEWKTECDLSAAASQVASPGASPEGTAEYSFRCLKDEAVSGRSCAVIEYTQTGKLKVLMEVRTVSAWVESEIKAKGQAWVDRRTGLVLKRQYEGESRTDLGSGTMVQKVKGLMTLQSSPE